MIPQAVKDSFETKIHKKSQQRIIKYQNRKFEILKLKCKNLG